MELFELELLGDATERAFRAARPEVEAMPWGTLELDGVSAEVLLAARMSWTGAAFQEYLTATACAAMLQAMLECRAPLDLTALACRFPLDELVHVELCARMAMELGGGTEIRYDPTSMLPVSDPSRTLLMQASELAVRYFCVGEALSIPLLHGTWKAQTHPLPEAVLGRIVRDEADHGTFGYLFLDWALEDLTEEDRGHLAVAADRTIAGVTSRWELVRTQPRAPAKVAHSLGWLETDAYLELAARSLRRRVMNPLLERDIPLDLEALEPHLDH